MLQLIGLLIILNSLVVAGWWLMQQKPGMAACISLCLIGVFVGIVLIFNERAVEITIKNVGTIKAVAEQAKVDAQTISDIKQRIEGQAATVDAVAKTAYDAKRVAEDVESKSQEADKKLKNIDDAVKQGRAAVAELQAYTAFNNAVIAAQNDDRKSFDQLKTWAQDKNYPFSKAAQQAWMTILDSHDSAMSKGGFTIPWKEGVDPEKLSFEELQANYKEAPAHIRLGFVEYIWQRQDLQKQQRMQFLIDVLQTDSSLNVVEYAGRYFSAGSKDRLKPLAIEQHVDWWNKNKDSIQ